MTFEDWIKLVLQSNAVAAIIVGIFGLVTLKMGIAKYASEKWWERKAAAYASVIDGLYGVHKASAAYADAFDTRQDLDDDYSEELVQGSVAGYAEMQRGENIGAFLMTKRAVDILKQLRLDLNEQGMPFGEVHRARANLVRNAITAMMIEAKRDLRT
ncbi:hypothetical protein ABIF97_006987 [Bradyrhizobium japonicum]